MAGVLDACSGQDDEMMDPSRNVEAHATSESGIFQSVNWDTTCRWQVGFKL